VPLDHEFQAVSEAKLKLGWVEIEPITNALKGRVYLLNMNKLYVMDIVLTSTFESLAQRLQRREHLLAGRLLSSGKPVRYGLTLDADQLRKLRPSPAFFVAGTISPKHGEQPTRHGQRTAPEPPSFN
jgi:hypothetical protein